MTYLEVSTTFFMRQREYVFCVLQNRSTYARIICLFFLFFCTTINRSILPRSQKNVSVFGLKEKWGKSLGIAFLRKIFPLIKIFQRKSFGWCTFGFGGILKWVLSQGNFPLANRCFLIACEARNCSLTAFD